MVDVMTPSKVCDRYCQCEKCREARGPVDPRTEADAHIAHALNIVCDAADADDDSEEEVLRDYTLDELESLFFSLSMAMIQLKKLPGGREARDRFRANSEAELKRRGRQDVLGKLDAEAELRRVDRALNDIGAPREASLGVEGRVRWLGAELRQAELRAVRPELDEEAVGIVRRTFGSNVDLSVGTVGHAMVQMVTLELKNLNALREKCIALAIEIRQD